ncbi:hypothetical protein BV898_04328 [Hypsibius exemplaris]|uniref:Uncharacterized protein n=1 Tax=Hypsibius exemplaris TaxID=2072580 RepID=A0A1W0X2S8_HYPEX|nr:hypothetical protein BV898_04328 [Hypsibius exemplaris]
MNDDEQWTSGKGSINTLILTRMERTRTWIVSLETSPMISPLDPTARSRKNRPNMSAAFKASHPFSNLHDDEGSGDRAGKKRAASEKHEAVQTVNLDQALTQLKIEIKKLSQNNFKLEGKVKSFEHCGTRTRKGCVLRSRRSGDPSEGFSARLSSGSG